MLKIRVSKSWSFNHDRFFSSISACLPDAILTARLFSARLKCLASVQRKKMREHLRTSFARDTFMTRCQSLTTALSLQRCPYSDVTISMFEDSALWCDDARSELTVSQIFECYDYFRSSYTLSQ